MTRKSRESNPVRYNIFFIKACLYATTVFFNCQILVAQNYLPEVIHYYNAGEGYYWGIPTIANEEEKISFRTNYSGYTGVRNVVYSSYSNMLFQQSHYMAGADILYTQIGDFINETGLRGFYAYKINLRQDLKMVQSVNVGINNLSIGGKGASGGASVFKPDLTLGNVIKYKQSMVGASFEHLINAKFQPYAESWYYRQRLNLLFSNSYKFGLGKFRNYFTALCNVNLGKNTSDKSVDVNLTEEVELMRNFKLGAHLVNVDLLGLGGGIKFLTGKYHFMFECYYYSNLGNTSLNSNRYQLRLKFFLEELKADN